MLRKILLSSTSERGEQQRIPVPSGGPHPVPYLLIISASPLAPLTWASWLWQGGIAARVCANGVIALRSLVKSEARIPDLVLLDDDGARSSGYGLIRTLKTLPQCGQTRVIVLSRFDGVIERLFSRLAGADDYLVKPISAPALLSVVARYVDTAPAREVFTGDRCGTCKHAR